MSLSWNEIKTHAIAFANEWKDEESEDAEAKSFWDWIKPLNFYRPQPFVNETKGLGFCLSCMIR